MSKKNVLQMIHVYVQDGSLRTLKVDDFIRIKEVSKDHVSVTLKNGDEFTFKYNYKALQSMRN